MRAKFVKYWGKIPYLYYFANILDPRYQLHLFYDTCEILGEILSVDYVNIVYTDARDKFYNYLQLTRLLG